jgi:hypothetical protein
MNRSPEKHGLLALRALPEPAEAPKLVAAKVSPRETNAKKPEFCLR